MLCVKVTEQAICCVRCHFPCFEMFVHNYFLNEGQNKLEISCLLSGTGKQALSFTTHDLSQVGKPLIQLIQICCVGSPWFRSRCFQRNKPYSFCSSGLCHCVPVHTDPSACSPRSPALRRDMRRELKLNLLELSSL